MGCGSSRVHLVTPGPSETTREGSVEQEDSPGAKDASGLGGTIRRSSIFRSFTNLARFNSNTGSTKGRFSRRNPEDLDRTHTPLPVSPANLAELQTMLDGADEGTTLDLQGTTVSVGGVELMDSRLALRKRITLYNGSLHLPPLCWVDAASEGCNAALSSVQIISGDAALPVVLVKDGARLRLDNCGVSGGVNDAVQVRDKGSSLEATGCQLSSHGDGAAMYVVLGGSATLTDCSLQGQVGLEVAGAGTQITARQCTLDGMNGGIENGVVVSAGATAHLQGCTMSMVLCCGLHVLGTGSRVVVKSCGINKCGMSNVSVHGGASVVLEQCTCSSSSDKCGLEVEGVGSSLHAVNVVACYNQEHNVHVGLGARAVFIDCTLDSAGTYGLNVESRASVHLYGCCISEGGMKNVVVSGGARAELHKCRSYGRRSYGMANRDHRQKWGWVQYGSVSQLHAIECVWSPTPTIAEDTHGTLHRPSQLFPGWVNGRGDAGKSSH